MEVYGIKLTRVRKGDYRIGTGDLHLVQDARPEANQRGKNRQWDIVHPSNPDRVLITGSSMSETVAKLALLEKHR